MAKKWAVLFVAGVFICSIPVFVFAQESFQQKIQGKLKVNRQLQQQNDQYYSSGDLDVSSTSNIKADDGRLDYVGRDKKGIKDEEVNMPVASPTVPSAEGRTGGLEAAKSRVIAEPVLVAPYLIYRTDYKADIEDDVVTVKGTVLFEVFRKGWTNIPLVNTDVGLIDASLSRGASFVSMQDGKYYLMIDRPGKYTLDIEFLIKAKRERENGPGNCAFEVMPAPISQFEFTMPDDQAEIFVDPSIKTEVRKEGKKTVAWAVMPNTNVVKVRWTKALPKETITPVALEPKVYVDTTTYAAIGEGVIRCLSTLTYSILQAEVPSFRVALPKDVTVLNVAGNELRDWKVSQDKGTQYLDVYPNFGIKGTYLLTISYERKIAEGSGVAAIPSVQAMNAEREKGFFGIAAASSVELAVSKSEHVSVIDVKELPSTIWGNTTSPILLAFKYLTHPFSIVIEVTKHEELPVLVAAIDSANYTTLQTDEGKSLTKAVYQMRNNVKQFIHLTLPAKATLWSVFVAGKPVKPAKDKNGTILIPLEKSQMSGESLAQFPVEIVYLDSVTKMHTLGNLSLHLPKTDIPISTLAWSLYLPREYAYFRFGGDVKEAREGMTFGLGDAVSMSNAVSLKRVYKEALYAPQQAAISGGEWGASEMQTRGVLPIKIDIPEQGKLYRFTKLLVTENESPSVSASYYYTFKKVGAFIRFILFLTIIIVGFLWLKALVKKYLVKS